MSSLVQSEVEGFSKVCKEASLSEGVGKRFIVDDVDVAVYKSSGVVYAVSNVCPHQHTALIYDGFIEDECVVCPVHGWMFNLKTGKTPSGSRGLDVYEVKIFDDDVYLRIKKKEWNW